MIRFRGIRDACKPNLRFYIARFGDDGHLHFKPLAKKDQRVIETFENLKMIEHDPIELSTNNDGYLAIKIKI